MSDAAVRGGAVLCLVRYYLPGYKSGGPVRTLANLTEHLGEEIDFRIITADRDHADQGPYPQMRIDDWNNVGKAQVFYASRSQRSLSNLARLISTTRHDVLYLNSFFDPVFTLRPLLARRLGLTPPRPWVIAPRGEFSDGALALKTWKKQAYKRMAAATGLYRDLTWQASSDYEMRDIRAAIGTAARRVAVAPDLPPLVHPDVSGREARRRDPRARLRVCFLSRITPKKNLDFALRVLASVRSSVEFQIYGPIEDARYWARCEALIAQLPDHVSVQYRGSVEHRSVGTVLSDHDLFLFPTLGENFGHVILESLLAGTPVLISDATPWRNLAQLGVGWDLPLNEQQAFAAAIDAAARQNAQEYELWRRRVATYAAERLNDSSVVDASRRMFRALTGAASGREPQQA